MLSCILFRFDPKLTGVVSSAEVGHILKYIGHNPTEAELQVNIDITDIQFCIFWPDFLHL